MKKRMMALVLTLALSATLFGCGGSKSSSGEASQGSSAPANEAEGEAASEEVSLPKNIEVQLPASAGGGTDVACRALTSFMNTTGGSNYTVVNNTDGGGVVAMETIRNAPADGSKILFFHTTMAIKTATGIYDYAAAEDFKVIGVGLPTEKGGYVLVASTESGITDVQGFIDAANAAGGEMMIGVETGGSSHIMSGMLAKELGITLNYVEAGPDTEKLTAIVGGSINCALVNSNQAKQYIEAGKVNAIACFSATDEGGRNSVIPDVPSFKEEGYDCVFGTYFYVLGSKDMSDATAQAIRDAFVAATEDEATNELLTTSGFGMEFTPYEEGVSAIQGQQEKLNAICEELGLVQ